MENKELTGVLVDINTNEIKEVTVIDTLNNLRKLINCHTIDIISRAMDEKVYTVVCDDEALLMSPVPRASLFNSMNKAEIFGNAFICQTDDEGELISLNKDEIAHIMSHIFTGTLIDHEDGNKQTTGINFLRVN